LLEQRGDAFIALPGGLGTFEELLEIIVSRSLGFHSKPIVLLNIADYWNPLLEMIDRAIEQNFIKPKARNLYFVAADVPQAIEFLKNYSPTNSATFLRLAGE
jgi:cytokinin riboside 5'-monophosphate phosphoribohydrolase